MSTTWPIALASIGLLLACAPASRPADIQPAPVSPVAAVDTLIALGGHRLHYRIWERPSAITLVLESGGASDLSSWESVPELLANQLPLRVIAYDRAGLGRSEVGPLSLTPDQEIAQLQQTVERLAPGPVIMIGHSFGGLLSFLHAYRYPGRVAGLVLVDAMNPVFINRMGLDWMRQQVPDIRNPGNPREVVISRMTRTIAELTAQTDSAVRALQIPMVFITAGRPWWPEASVALAWSESHDTLAAGKANRRLLVAARSGHGIPTTEPGMVVEAVRQLLTLLPPVRGR
jgi:pimeloyl-ACP methyl ester carboxylesterase